MSALVSNISLNPAKALPASLPPSPRALSSPSVYYQLANQALGQSTKVDRLGEGHYVSIMDNGSLTVKFLKNFKVHAIKQLAAGLFRRGEQLPLQERQKNQLTWKLFKGAMIAQAGQEKFDWICHRYRDQLPVKLLESGDPLLLCYIKIFYTGLSQLNVEWMERQKPEIGPLNRLTRQQLTGHIRDFHQKMTSISPETALNQPIAALSPRPEMAFFGLGTLFHDERKALGTLWSYLPHFQAIPNLRLENPSSPHSPLTTRFLPWLEEFCKGTVNQEFINGQLIPVPGEEGFSSLRLGMA